MQAVVGTTRIWIAVCVYYNLTQLELNQYSSHDVPVTWSKESAKK